MAEGTPTWHEQLEQSLQGNEGLSQYQSISDLAKAHLTLGETEKTLRGELEGKVKIPGENATDEEKVAFYKALGVPEKAEDYQVEKPEQFPEGYTYDEVLEKDFKELAYKLGFTANQVKAMSKFYIDRELNFHNMINEEIAKNREKSINTLKDIWKGDEYKQNSEKAVRGFYKVLDAINPPESLGGKDAFKKEFDESGFGDSPYFVYYFSRLFDVISDDTFLKGQRGSEDVERTGSGIPMLSFPSMDKT